jgi:hypothetical protein
MDGVKMGHCIVQKDLISCGVWTMLNIYEQMYIGGRGWLTSQKEEELIGDGFLVAQRDYIMRMLFTLMKLYSRLAPFYIKPGNIKALTNFLIKKASM